MSEKKSVAIIICYFGELPWYFNYFVHSCRYNPTIDFYFITDRKSYPIQIPENFKIVQSSLVDISNLASDKLGFEVSLDYSYKLCDFKPAYGHIFSDLIKGYDFWGYGDIDVIYGNIRKFATNYVLENFDLLSIQPNWLPGCFLLVRNNEKMTKIFMKSKDYRKVFESRTHYCFDETNFTHYEFNEGIPYDLIPTEIESMSHLIKRLERSSYLNPYFDLHIIEGDPGNLKWDRGNLIYKNKFEALLYHLIDFKTHFKPSKLRSAIPNQFRISTRKIYHTSQRSMASAQKNVGY